MSDVESRLAKAVKDALATPADTRTREQRLEQAMQGIASCATQCPCCEMHRRVAVRALGYDVAIVTDKID